jgi:hypothetical protein
MSATSGSSWLESRANAAAGHDIFVAGITEVELISAVVGRALGGSMPVADVPVILAQFRHDLAHDYQVLDITPALLKQAAAHAENHGLRASHAIQLAAVLALDASSKAASIPVPVLVYADQELSKAAAAQWPRCRGSKLTSVVTGMPFWLAIPALPPHHISSAIDGG